MKTFWVKMSDSELVDSFGLKSVAFFVTRLKSLSSSALLWGIDNTSMELQTQGVATLANHANICSSSNIKSDSGIPNIPRGFERALKSHAQHRSSTAIKFEGQLPVLNF